MTVCQNINVDITDETVIEAVITEAEITVEIAETSEITVEVSDVTVAVDLGEVVLNIEVAETEVITVEVDPCGSGGDGGGQGSIFVTDITSAGVVSSKVYVADTVPTSKVLASASSDNNDVVIYFQAEGGDFYSPVVSIGVVECSNLQQVSGDLRIFTGSIPVTLTQEAESFSLESDTGFSANVMITKGDDPPDILTCVIGAYPGIQTTAKSGDNIHVTGTVEGTATHVRIIAVGGFVDSGWVSCSGGVFDITGIVNSATGLQNASVYAKNVLSAEGNSFVSSNQVMLDQTVPAFSFNSITYPASQTAFKGVETGSIDVLVSDFTSIIYSSPHGDFTIANTTTYEQDKGVTCLNPGDYNDSATNFRIVASKSSNDSTNTYDDILEVADIAPVLTLTQPFTRLRSSAIGTDYTITATSDQNLTGVPDVTIPVSGTWVGSFVGGAKIFTRDITIADADGKGMGAWSLGSAIANGSGLSANIAGSQTVGGFVSRNIALAAFGTAVSLGTAVVTTGKLSLVWTFKENMVFSAIGTSAPVVYGWTIDATGINPTSVIILDTAAAASSSQESTITIEEIV